MGRGDNRSTRKVRQKKAQRSLKARVKAGVANKTIQSAKIKFGKAPSKKKAEAKPTTKTPA